MPTQPVKKTIHFSDLIHLNFWRHLLRAIWLFFPAIIFLLLSYFCFWKLTQGKDLMVITLENRDVFFYFIVALVFWSYITWYSSRLVGKAREFEQPEEDRIWTTLRVQGPRILAFTCYTLILLAFFRLTPKELPQLADWLCSSLFILSLPLYFFCYTAWNQFTGKVQDPVVKRKFLKSVQTTTWLMLAAGSIGVVIFKSFAGLIILLLALQQAMVLLLIIRRKLIENKGESFYQQTDMSRGFDKYSSLPEKIKGLLFDKEDSGYFRFFLYTGIFISIIYLLTVFSVPFAVKIGSFPFVLIAFSFLLLLGNTVAFISVLKQFNFHLLFIGLGFLIGLAFEPHYVKLPAKKEVTASFNQRQNLKEYFTNWLNNPERSSALSDSAVKEYPVFFVLADGGASRSGYWVASVLAKLEDSSHSVFSKHLFCLSGASGGSVGNAAFFSLLRSKEALLKKDTGAAPFYNAATSYLKSDFLTFTLARMLGPDVFRHIVPLRNTDDRAAALAHALETASGSNSFLYDSLGIGFSQIITQKNKPDYDLPILCINATRMQDGSPSVITTIDIGDSAFNKRVDVLTLLNEEQDLKLSSAVVLGASFPYISPAGRFNTKVTMRKKEGGERVVTEPHYFVDGGYFDNSGAGVVNEMIIQLQAFLKKDTLLNKKAAKLKFYVLHVSNGGIGDPLLKKVNPLINDLAAPLKTLIGGFSSQTSVNDRRLYNYMKSQYGNTGHYIGINLYRRYEPVDYSMNWVISDYLLKAMDDRLRQHETISTVMQLLR